MKPTTKNLIDRLEKGIEYAVKEIEAPEEEQQKDISEILRARRFDINNRPKGTDFCFFVEGEKGKKYKVGGFGMFGIITGLEKSRKSTFLAAVTASAISGGKSIIKTEMRLHGRSIAFIDTEQPEEYFYRTQERIHHLAGLTTNAANYAAYQMRDLDREVRIAAIDEIMRTPGLGLVVIDGALDLVSSFNDEVECMQVTERFLKWTKESGAMIITVIHVNSGGEKALGHLGSMLRKKCDFAINTKYDKKSGFTTVQPSLSRSLPFESYEFTQDSEGYPILNHNEKADLPQGVGKVELSEIVPDTWTTIKPSQNGHTDAIPF